MKKIVLSLIFVAVFSFSITSAKAIAAEANFNPNTQYYDMNSEGVLNLWGIPEANGNSVRANPDFGWPSEFVVAAWYATILKAHQMNMYVVVGYDPVSYDIWYVANKILRIEIICKIHALCKSTGRFYFANLSSWH